jgi:hypothetical protein
MNQDQENEFAKFIVDQSGINAVAFACIGAALGLLAMLFMVLL